MPQLDDTRINSIRDLLTPNDIINEMPPVNSQMIYSTRNEIVDILNGKSHKKLAIVGPCSIHSPDEALDYVKMLKTKIESWPNLVIVFRSYFEKPRSITGWKGYIYDCNLDGTSDINKGFRLARKLLCDINGLGIPCSLEWLDLLTPQYLGDLVSWGAIGARTVSSQIHRQLVSGLSSPVGFKNCTSGDFEPAVCAIKSASHEHSFFSIGKNGKAVVVDTSGNPDTHIVLRGGKYGPNYSHEHVAQCEEEMKKKGIAPRIMIDVSHDNSSKKYKNQSIVLKDVCNQIKNGSKSIIGVMIESNIHAGNQDINSKPLKYGVSVTDECVDFAETIDMLDKLNSCVPPPV